MFRLSQKQKIKLINFYPPYIGAGIRVKSINDNITRIEVRMKMHWWNKNLFGTHFGGSLASMTDPFYVFILLMNLGKEYIVWDKASLIQYKRPGKGTVSCVFEMTLDEIREIKNQVDSSGKKDFVLPLSIKDNQGKVVCELEKTIYVKKRSKSEGSS